MTLHAVLALIVGVALLAVLVALAVIDMRTMKLINPLVLSVLGISIVADLIVGHFSLPGLIVAIVLSVATIGLVKVQQALKRRRSMGLGDAKLMAALSVMLIGVTGIFNVLVAVWVFYILFAIGLVVILIVGRLRHVEGRKMPAGPAFILPGLWLWFALVVQLH